MLSADTFEPGKFEIPFEFVVEPIAGEELVESYHGVYVNVVFTVSAELKRSGMFARPLHASVEFYVHTPVRAHPTACSVCWLLHMPAICHDPPNTRRD